MTNQQATRRYFGALIPGMIAFLGLSYGISVLDKSNVVSDGVLIAAALLPVAVLLGVFWVHWRYMSEIDEYLRSIQYKAAFAALALVLTVATGWGYLELLADVPVLPIYWLNPMFWVAYSVAAVLFSRRDVVA